MACELMFLNLALIDCQRLTFRFLNCRVIRGCPGCPSAASRYMLTWTQFGHLKRAKMAKSLRKINSEMREFRLLISKIRTKKVFAQPWLDTKHWVLCCASAQTWTSMVWPCKLGWLQYINLLRRLLCIPWSRGVCHEVGHTGMLV